SWVDQILTRLAKREAANRSQKERFKRLRHMFLQARGALLVRAGRPKEAAAALREALPLHPQGGEFLDWVYLALAEHTLGGAKKAETAAIKARAARAGPKPSPGWERAEVELLTAELDAALPPAGK